MCWKITLHGTYLCIRRRSKCISLSYSLFLSLFLIHISRYVIMMIKIQDLLEELTEKFGRFTIRGAVSVVVISINHSYTVFAARFTTRLRLVCSFCVSFFSSFLLAQSLFQKSLFNFTYRNLQFWRRFDECSNVSTNRVMEQLQK